MASLEDPSIAYKTDHKLRGQFLIFNQVEFDPQINQSERYGSDVDADALETTFTRLGFSVIVFKNLSKAELLSLLQEQQAKDHSDSDCLGIAILSHGDVDYFYARDEKVRVQDVASMLQADKCPSLAAKPKLFFVQACRGRRYDDGALVNDASSCEVTDGVEEMVLIPLEADFFFFYSTPIGYYSWRNERKGSWFVQELCRVLQEHGSKHEFTHLMLTVQRLVSRQYESTAPHPANRKKQMPVTVSQLRKLLYFRDKSA